MQNNTTGQFMTGFLDLLLIIAIVLSIMTNVAYLVYFNKNNKSCDKILKEYPIHFKEIKDELTHLRECNNVSISDIDRSLLDLKESIQPIKPSIRPNNWDSMKQAFKVPTKVEINE